MPKLNVYLPDDLAVQVRAAGLPVSAICQKALTDALGAVRTARQAIATIRDPEVPLPRPAEGAMPAAVTPRLRRALQLAGGAASPCGSADLLHGIVAEGENLAVRLLAALGVDPDEADAIAAAARVDEPVAPGDDGATSDGVLLSEAARQVIAAALEAALSLGHNYVGCEHLLLALVTEPASGVRAALAERGVDDSAVRRAIAGATAGIMLSRATSPSAPAELQRRIDDLERRLANAGL